MKTLIATYDFPLNHISVVGELDTLQHLLATLSVYDPHVKEIEIRDLDGGLIRGWEAGGKNYQ